MSERSTFIMGANHQQAVYWQRKLGLESARIVNSPPQDFMGCGSGKLYLVGRWWERRDFDEREVMRRDIEIEIVPEQVPTRT